MMANFSTICYTQQVFKDDNLNLLPNFTIPTLSYPKLLQIIFKAPHIKPSFHIKYKTSKKLQMHNITLYCTGIEYSDHVLWGCQQDLTTGFIKVLQYAIAMYSQLDHM